MSDTNKFEVSYVSDKEDVKESGKNSVYIDNGKIRAGGKDFFKVSSQEEQLKKILTGDETELLGCKAFRSMLFSCGLANMFFDCCFMHGDNFDSIKYNQNNINSDPNESTDEATLKSYYSKLVNERAKLSALCREFLEYENLETKPAIRFKEYLKTPILGGTEWNSLPDDPVEYGIPYNKESVYFDGEKIDGISFCRKKDEYDICRGRKDSDFTKGDLFLITIAYGDGSTDKIEFENFFYAYDCGDIESSNIGKSQLKIKINSSRIDIIKGNSDEKTDWAAIHSIKRFYNDKIE